MVITGLTRNQLSGSYRTKGSNPLPSATEKACNQADCRLFFLCLLLKQVVRAYRILYSPKFGFRHPPIGSQNHRIRARQALFPSPVLK